MIASCSRNCHQFSNEGLEPAAVLANGAEALTNADSPKSPLIAHKNAGGLRDHPDDSGSLGLNDYLE
jgi:hypothetical protein